MKTKLLMAGILSATLLFQACKKNDPAPATTAPLSTSESKTVLATSDASAETSVSAYSKTEAAAATSSLSSIESGNPLVPSVGSLRSEENDSEKNLPDFANDLGTLALKVTAGNSNARIAPDFNASKGVYNYDFTTQKLVKAGTSDKIEINFPDSVGKATKVNNCKYTISSLTTQILTYQSYEYNSSACVTKTDTSISSIVAQITKSGKVILDINYTINYTSRNIGVGSGYITAGEFKQEVSLNSGNSYSKVSINTSKNGVVFHGYEIETTSTKKTTKSQYECVFGDSTLTASYKVTFGDISYKASFDFANLYANLKSLTTNYDTTVIRRFIKQELFQASTGAKIGDVRYYSGNFYVVYVDGSKQLLSIVAPKFYIRFRKYFNNL
ncbi:MAG: hypothetical protein K2Q22_15825 [Cytophagales bacterium]|nr:hypothetical protein [Cytophagales bacterium]